MKKEKPHRATFREQVGEKEQTKLTARRKKKQSEWMGFSMFGIVGWSVVIPTVAGAGLGWWLDKHYPRNHSWTLALLLAGLVLGCFIAWNWLSRENENMHKEENNNHE